MSRVNVYSYSPGDFGNPSPAELAGWFDPAKAERFDQDTKWDGNNIVGVLTGSQWVDEYLYRTKGGLWVRNHDAHRYCDGPDLYEFLTEEQAKDWLLRSGNHDDVIERFFGEVEEEKGPGRPEIGPAINVRLGDLLGAVDTYAAEREIKRAQAVRLLIMAGLDAEERAAAAMALEEAGTGL